MTGDDAAKNASIAREAALTGLLVVGLGLALVGVRIQDGTAEGSPLVFRFDDVLTAGAVAALGRAGNAALRLGRAVPVLAAAGGAAVVLMLLEVFASGHPLHRTFLFDTGALNWMAAAFALLLAVRAAWRLRHRGASLATQAAREATMDGIAARVQKFARYAGPLILLFAVALPFMPFADRRLIDIAILVVTYIMLGGVLNIVGGLAGLLDLG
ncbi:MAG: hypothetical protein AAB543_01795, partial [Pseudomonadota bacterium]